MPKMFKILIKGKLGSNNDVMIVDDISVIDRACESHRFEINNFAQVRVFTETFNFFQISIIFLKNHYKGIFKA